MKKVSNIAMKYKKLKKKKQLWKKKSNNNIVNTQ